MDKPKPVPFPTSFVVKKGSNNRCLVASSMPAPVSFILIVTISPSCLVLKEIAPEQQLWEVREGNEYRGEFLFTAQLHELEAHRKILQGFIGNP